MQAGYIWLQAAVRSCASCEPPTSAEPLTIYCQLVEPPAWLGLGLGLGVGLGLRLGLATRGKGRVRGRVRLRLRLRVWGWG